MDDRTAGEYLRRIGAPPDADVATLQQRHLAAVPFENLDIHLGEPISLDETALVDKIVRRRRGGFCYELNGLFAALLVAGGHHVDVLAARVYGDGDRLGPPFDHLALVVYGQDHHLLVDVGFGQFSRRPLRFDDRAPQRDPAGLFQLVDVDGGVAGDHGDVDVLMDGRPQYRLERRPRRLDEFVPTCWWQQTSPDSHFTSGPLCSLPTPDGGRVTIRGDRLIRTGHGDRHEEILPGEAEILAAYRSQFGIDLDRVPTDPSAVTGPEGPAHEPARTSRSHLFKRDRGRGAHDAEMSDQQLPKSVWPCVNYADAPAAITFLTEAFGFVSTATYTDENDETVVNHAELTWPEGGGVMLGSAGREDSEFSTQPTGVASVYVVTDEPDAVHDGAVKAGAEIVRGLVDEDYGSRGFTARDPEGNLWSFGTYRGHPPA